MLIYKDTKNPLSAVVFISGSGTNLDAIVREQHNLEKLGDKNFAKVEAVFTNNPDSLGVVKAKNYDIPVISLNSNKYFKLINKPKSDEEYRMYYDAAALSLIEQTVEPDLIVLAGYNRRLSKLFFDKYENRIINLYPGDITKSYLIRGVPAVIQALRSNESELKCTVYIQKYEQRFGPAIAQSKPISLSGHTEEDSETINNMIRKEGEWQVFPFVIHHLIANGRVGIDSDDKIFIDDVEIGPGGYQL